MHYSLLKHTKTTVGCTVRVIECRGNGPRDAERSATQCFALVVTSAVEHTFTSSIYGERSQGEGWPDEGWAWKVRVTDGGAGGGLADAKRVMPCQ